MISVLGIDYSINSPGITELLLNDKTLDVESKKYIGFTQTKKWQSKTDEGIIISYNKEQFKNNIEQQIFIEDNISSFYADYVAFEGYAFGAKGLVFDIAEATGACKRAFYNKGSKIRIYDPCSIKMYATNMGNCDKIHMEDEYNKLSKKDIFDLKDLPQYKSPKSDIIDSYYIAKLLQLELKLRKGLILLKDLPEKTIKIFNRTTRANPINVLAQDFIEK